MSDDRQRRNAIIETMSRDQMVAYLARQTEKIETEARRLALDLSIFNGTSFEDELAKLYDEMRAAIEATP